MKTIYSDRYNVYPWAMLFCAGCLFWTACDGFSKGSGSTLGLGIAGGAFFLFQSLKRFRDVRRAKLEGRDPSIMRITDA